jgi:hypothetical protein
MPFDAAPISDGQVGANGRVRLAVAMLSQAWDDATTPLNDMRDRYDCKRVQIIEARQFCTDRSGPWAKKREEWCLIADIEPDTFRQQALAAIARADSERRKIKVTHR